jgi:hypothetical protein
MDIAQLTDRVLALAAALLDWIAVWLTVPEAWLRDQLARAGLSGPSETVAAALINVVLLIIALRLFGGVLRVVLAVLLVLLLITVLRPVLHGQFPHTP